MVETVSVLTLIVALINFGWSLYNFRSIEDIKSKKNLLPIKILGTKFLRPITFEEKIGSAQVKSCIILSALNTPGITKIYSKKSRNHTELMLKFLKYPINVKKKNGYDEIINQG